MRNLLLAIFCPLLLSACDQAAITGSSVRGTVLDIQGEPIPGVVVTVDQEDRQCITDALGQYHIPVKNKSETLSFMKSGYTSGTLELADIGLGTVTARAVSLWCLPQTSGLFLFENFKYRRAAAWEPKPYVASDGAVVHGIAKLADIEETALNQPLLLCYKMPPYDVKLSRLGKTKAAAPESPSVKQDIWTAVENLTVSLTPVDEPQRLLWEVRLASPLQPGIYAYHWGAMDGHTSTDERIFLFAVAAETGESSVPTEETAPPEPRAKKEAAEKKTPQDKDSTEEPIPDEAPDEAADQNAPQ